MSKTTTTAKTTTTSAARSIAIHYRAVDGAAKSGTFKTIKGAQAFAHKWVGATPELSIGATTTADSGSATAGDGVGRITWKGCTPAELFPLCAEVAEPAAPVVPDLPAGTAARKASRKPGKVKTLTAEQLAAQQAADQRRQYGANLEAIASWLPAAELEVLKGSAEHFEIVADMRERIADMPTSYSTTDQGDDAMVWLHYFNAASDWWLTEKDAEGSGRRQCFGFARLNGDSQNAELGYVDVRELVENGVELDLHWTPVRLGDIVAKFGPASIRDADDSQPPRAAALDPEAAEIAETIDRGLRIAHAAHAEQQAQQQDAQRASQADAPADADDDDDADELDEPPQAPADDVKAEALPPQQRIELPVRKLLAAVACAAVKDVRYYLCTVMLHQPDDKGARIVSTDGHRLLVQAADLPKPADWMDGEGVLLSADDLREALPMLKKHGEAVTIEWGRGHSHATLRSADGFAALRVSIVEGKYPDYQRILSGVDLSNRGGEVGDAARINPDFLKGAASVASLLGSKGVQAFAGSSSGASTFLFDGEADAVMLIMPMRGAEAGAMVTAKVAGLVGAAGLASSVAALRAHLTRTVSALRRAAAEGAPSTKREELEARRISLEQRIADTLALCSAALPAPAKA